MTDELVCRAEAFAAARGVFDAARRRRDSVPPRDAARAAAVNSRLSADEIEALILRLRARAAVRTAA